MTNIPVGNMPQMLLPITSIGTKMPPFPLILGVLLALYMGVVAIFRHNVERTLKKRFHYPDRKSLANMSLYDAWAIQYLLVSQEFPFTIIMSLRFAIFSVVGIPTISGLLVKTNQLAKGTGKGIHKRYTDTTIMIAEFYLNPPNHKRTVESIARMNYIHGVYQKAGKISNDDMLYILSLFVLNPIRWIKKAEWRELNDMEKCAMATFWKSLGDDMGIDYSPLRSSASGWTDALHWLEDIEEWSQNYENKCMAVHEDNAAVTRAALDIVTWKLPNPLKPFAKQAVSCLLDQRMRQALMVPEPPKAVQHFVSFLIQARRLMIRYLCLPRTHYRRLILLSEKPEKNGRYYLWDYDSLPYYVPPTVFNRWGPFALFQRWLGRDLPGDNPEYSPAGYTVYDLGPSWMFGEKKEERDNEIKAMAEKLAKERKTGCPFR